MQFLVDILPLGSGSVDPHIFEDLDPDPGSQNLADPDPKHWTLGWEIQDFYLDSRIVNSLCLCMQF